MSVKQSAPLYLQNEQAFLKIDLFGGAIADFHLHGEDINPLSFRFGKEDMPDNNKNGAPYQGHFACIGRWGEPSEGEKKMGLPDHGAFANMMWAEGESGKNFITMNARSESEGIGVERIIKMDNNQATFQVTETISNIHTLGRMFNVVQHPTIAAPFLNGNTRIFCNADTGFNYEAFMEPEKMQSKWPMGKYGDNIISDLSFSLDGYTGVHSFIINREDEYGWLTAYSPRHQLLIGYLWKRDDYPWINIWCDYQSGVIRYRGLEFGTTGMHQPFPVMLKTGNLHIFGEPVFRYLDAGSTIKKNYRCFLLKTPEIGAPVTSVKWKNEKIEIYC